MFNGGLSKLQERLKAKLLNKKQPKLAESVEVMAKSRVRMLNERHVYNSRSISCSSSILRGLLNLVWSDLNWQRYCYDSIGILHR